MNSCKVQREPLRKTILGIFFTILGKILLPLPLKIIYGLRIRGRENLKSVQGTGVITVSNHCLYMEPVFAGLALKRRRVWYIVEEQNIVRRDIGWLNSILGAIGIPETEPEAIALPVRHILERGEAVHFFPEGKLFFRNQRIQPFYTGAFILALRNNVPVLPLTEVLLDRKARNLLPFLPPKVSFIIGKPVYPEQIKRLCGHSEILAGRSVGHSAVFAEYVRDIMQRTIERERAI
jgi:1-acyl-sn-glycerol-3-phosphate acyltransferase